jgi:1-acyl-sn-glycerol-3-phosphate acyltransferase/nucleoside-diphosphate-sugar epimerase
VDDHKVIAFVARREPGSEAVLRHLTKESGWECRLFEAPAAESAGALRGAEAVVYAAAARSRDPREPVDRADARTVLSAAVEAGVPRIVVLSSTEVIEPSHAHLGLVSEEQIRPQLQPRKGRNRWSEGWRSLEELAGEVVGPVSGSRLTILRAAPVPVPRGRDFFSRLLTRPVALTVPGFDPSIQLLAPEDLARAVAAALGSDHGDAPGTASPNGPALYHVVPRGTAPLHRAIRLAGGHRLAVPRWLQRLGRRVLGPTRRVHAAERVDYLRYPWSAGGAGAASALGFVPRLSTVQVARSLRNGGDPVVEADPESAPEPDWEWGAWSADPGTDSDQFDDFGMDRTYVERYGRTLFRFLHDLYWRIEARGLEHVPRSGRGVLTGVHRGFMPYDGVMALHLLVREAGRYPRFLLHPTLTKFPFLANFMTKLGGIMACQENADWVLERDGLVGIYPEGIRGAFTPYRRAYRLGKFGRDEFVRMALRNRAPIIPFVTVGSAEIFPILGRIDWSWWKRYSEWPYLPITPTFPLLPVPLPSKWHTRILEPLPVHEAHGPEAAEDSQVVREISLEVRHRMEAAIAEMLARRKSVFFGSVFPTESPSKPLRDE